MEIYLTADNFEFLLSSCLCDSELYLIVIQILLDTKSDGQLPQFVHTKFRSDPEWELFQRKFEVELVSKGKYRIPLYVLDMFKKKSDINDKKAIREYIRVNKFFSKDKYLLDNLFEKVNNWVELFPELDIMKELKKANSWCEDNAKKIAKRSGFGRTLNFWLNKAYEDQVNQGKIKMQKSEYEGAIKEA